MISIIMPSYLGEYKTAAKNRDKKIVRAIKSVQNQTCEYWQLVVVADGCKQTQDIVKQFDDSRIITIFVEKQDLWSGTVRNTGLDNAKGEYCCYLDIDDAFAPTHIEGLSKFNKKDWYWFDDYVWNGQEFRHRRCNVARAGHCGTSNYLHRRNIARWKTRDGYAHDWNFLKNLKRASKDYEYIRAGGYLVCHVPGKFDI